MKKEAPKTPDSDQEWGEWKHKPDPRAEGWRSSDGEPWPNSGDKVWGYDSPIEPQSQKRSRSGDLIVPKQKAAPKPKQSSDTQQYRDRVKSGGRRGAERPRTWQLRPHFATKANPKAKNPTPGGRKEKAAVVLVGPWVVWPGAKLHVA